MKLKKSITALILAATCLLSGCSEGFNPNELTRYFDSNFGGTAVDSDTLSFAKENVNYLPVKEKVDRGTYNRSEFGSSWTDSHTAELGGNGCDTRNDILKRDLINVRYSDAKKCVVVTGTLEEDPYTGRTINFRRGVSTSSAIQIDHIVSLKDAWLSGADKLTFEERVNLANDPINLVAADGPENMSKGYKAADMWLVPSNPEFRCSYAAQQVLVKANYGLSVSESEKRALVNTLSTCG